MALLGYSSTDMQGTGKHTTIKDCLAWASHSSSSSTFLSMLDFQYSEKGEVRSLPQCLDWSPKLPVGIHRTGPRLGSQNVEGGAGLQDVVGGLRTCVSGKFAICGGGRGVDSVRHLILDARANNVCRILYGI